MKITTTWQEKMLFNTTDGTHTAQMDTNAPIGSDQALSPKQLLLAAVSGCTAMDVIALMRKYRQDVKEFHIDVDAPVTEGSYPVIFKEIKLSFHLSGEIDPAKAVEAVTLSQTKFCGVSAMVAKAVPIHYSVLVNGENIHHGEAKFEI